jgi:hypothetical protein
MELPHPVPVFHLSRPSSSDAPRRPSRQGVTVIPQSSTPAAVPASKPERRNHQQRRPNPSARSDAANVSVAVFSGDGQLLSLTNERQELLCSVIGLLVKLGLVAVASVSLIRLAGAYQQRMERQGEISAVLELELAQMAKARQRFDSLFNVEGEQRLIREQSQWIAPNRLRVVWQQPQAEPKPVPTVETAQALPTVAGLRP